MHYIGPAFDIKIGSNENTISGYDITIFTRIRDVISHHVAPEGTTDPYFLTGRSAPIVVVAKYCTVRSGGG